jgi:4-aminobutyrate aminotransferase-like enzyme
MSGQKSWIVILEPAIIIAPFPDGYWVDDSSFDAFLNAIEKSGLKPSQIAGVIMESYQGVGPDFAPVEYIQKLRAWCDENQVVLTFDEVQSGFGRTGKFWAFEHYGVVPDLICCGKGISSSLPLSAVIGRADIMDQFPPGSMTSTHSGNPVCCAAALAASDARYSASVIMAGEVLRTMDFVVEGGRATHAAAYCNEKRQRTSFIVARSRWPSIITNELTASNTFH